MRMIALIQEPKVIDKTLRYLRDKGWDARAGLWATGPPETEPAADAADRDGDTLHDPLGGRVIGRLPLHAVLSKTTHYDE